MSAKHERFNKIPHSRRALSRYAIGTLFVLGGYAEIQNISHGHDAHVATELSREGVTNFETPSTGWLGGTVHVVLDFKDKIQGIEENCRVPFSVSETGTVGEFSTANLSLNFNDNGIEFGPVDTINSASSEALYLPNLRAVLAKDYKTQDACE